MLRRFVSAVLVLCFLLCLVGCGKGEVESEINAQSEPARMESELENFDLPSEESGDESSKAEASSEKASSKEASSEVVNKPASSVLEPSSSAPVTTAKTVSVTIPGYLLAEEVMDGLTAEQKAMGFVSMELHDDYSATYEILESEYEAFLFTQKQICVSALKEHINTSEFPSIKDITYDDELTEITIKVDREIYQQNNDNWAIPSVAVCAMVYRAFKTGGNHDCEILVVDNLTSDVISHDKFPEVLGY